MPKRLQTLISLYLAGILFALASADDRNTDVRLLARIGGGDEGALELLFSRYKGLLFSLVLHMLQDRRNAEEIVSETFARVWRSAASFNPEHAAAKTWLVAIARNLAIDRLRSIKARPPLSQNPWDEECLNLSSGTDSPEKTTVQHDQARRVRSAISKLPAEHRSALALAYFNGLTHSEIATHLDLPLGTVKTRIRSAMLRLREEFMSHQSSNAQEPY